MTHHHAANSLGKFSKNRELCAVQLLPVSIDARKVMVRVELSASVTGEMLSTGQDTCFQESVIVGAGKLNDFFHRASVTSATERILFTLRERDVQDRAEV